MSWKNNYDDYELLKACDKAYWSNVSKIWSLIEQRDLVDQKIKQLTLKKEAVDEALKVLKPSGQPDTEKG